MLLENVALIPDIPIEKALLLTSCLTKLATCEWSTELRLCLLGTASAASHASLYSSMVAAADRTRRRCQGITAFSQKAHALRYAESLSLPPKEEGLILAFIMLCEFSKELGATFMVNYYYTFLVGNTLSPRRSSQPTCSRSCTLFTKILRICR